MDLFCPFFHNMPVFYSNNDKTIPFPRVRTGLSLFQPSPPAFHAPSASLLNSPLFSFCWISILDCFLQSTFLQFSLAISIIMLLAFFPSSSLVCPFLNFFLCQLLFFSAHFHCSHLFTDHTGNCLLDCLTPKTSGTKYGCLALCTSYIRLSSLTMLYSV